jgi:putative ABC transport system permease protein
MGLANRAFKSIWRRKWRTGVALVAIAIAMAIMISIPAGLNANQAAAVSARDSIQASLDAMNNEITNMSLVVEVSYGQAGRGVPGDRNTTMPTAPTATSTKTITATDVSNISSLDGVVTIVSYIEKTEGMPDMSSFTPGSFTPGSSTTRPQMNFSAVYSVWGIPTDATISGLTPTIVSGRAMGANETGAAVISQSLASSWGLGVGDTKTIEGVTLTIVGISSSTTTTSSASSAPGGSSMSDRVVYVDLAQAQAMYSMSGTFTNLYVYANTTAYAETIAVEVGTLLSSSTVTTSTERVAQLSATQARMTSSLDSQNATLAQTQATANQETVLALVATSAIILLIMVFSVRERVREIGVMKTLGFSNQSIVSQFMLEGLSVTLLGCIVGAVVGIVAYPTFSQLLMPAAASSTSSTGTPVLQTAATVSASPELSMVLIAFVAVLAMGAVGSIYPAWKASRIKPVEALRNE